MLGELHQRGFVLIAHAGSTIGGLDPGGPEFPIVKLGLLWNIFGILLFVAAQIPLLVSVNKAERPQTRAIVTAVISWLGLGLLLVFYEFWIFPDIRAYYNWLLGGAELPWLTKLVCYQMPVGTLTLVMTFLSLLELWLLYKPANLRANFLNVACVTLLLFAIITLGLIPIIMCLPFLSI